MKTDVAARAIFAVALACLGGLCAVSQAATVTAAPSVPAGTVIVNVHFTNSYGGASYTGGVYAGPLSFGPNGSVVWTGTGETPAAFSAYCIEFAQHSPIGVSATYDVVDVGEAPKPFGNPPGNPSNGMAGDGLGLTGISRESLVRKLYRRYISGLDVTTDASLVVGSDAQKAAGFQIALWKIIYENSTASGDYLSLTSTTANLWFDASPVLTYASQYLTNLTAGAGSWLEANNIYAITHELYQDQLIEINSTVITNTAVPLPMSAISGTALLGGLALARRNRCH